MNEHDVSSKKLREEVSAVSVELFTKVAGRSLFPNVDCPTARILIAQYRAELVQRGSVGDGWAYDLAYAPGSPLQRYLRNESD